MSRDVLGGLEPPDDDDWEQGGSVHLRLPERCNRLGDRFLRKARDGEPLSLEDAREECGDKTSNYVGTVLASTKPGYMGLRRDADGRFSPTYRNAYRAAKAMQPARLEKTIADLGMTQEEFAEWIQSLPRA